MSDRSNRDPQPDLRNNKIGIGIILGLVAVGIIWYGLTTYAFPPAPAPVAHATNPAPESTGQGPGTPGRL